MPTIDLTRVVEAFTLTAQAQTPTPTFPPTWTPVPPASPTNTLAPTLDAPPTLITATIPPDQIGLRMTPILGDTTPEPATGTPLPTFTPTLAPPTVTPTPTLPPIPFAAPFNVLNVQAARFNVPPGALYFGAPLPGAVGLLAVNPRDPRSYARVDPAGNLFFVPPGGGGEQRILSSPFHAGHPVAATAEENTGRITEIAWSPDGTKLAFVLRNLDNVLTNDTGLWVWFGDEAFAQGRDCPRSDFGSCNLANDRLTENYFARQVIWRSDSNAMLVLYTVLNNPFHQRAFAVVPVVRDKVDNAPRLVMYDSASYLSDGRLLVSGQAKDGEWIVGIMGVFPDGQPNIDELEVLFDGTSTATWVTDAVQRPDGVIVAFGRFGGREGPVQLGRVQNRQWQPFGPFIGEGTPSDIRWGPDRRQAVVTVNRVQYLVDAFSGRFTPLN